jgi:erythromycin esterase-like protein
MSASLREEYGSEAVLVGFTTHHGIVTAAADWGKIGRAQTRSPGAAR